MSYELPIKDVYNTLLRADISNWECVHPCDVCMFSDMTDIEWTCFRLTTTLSERILNRLIEHKVITKAEALDLMLKVEK